MAGLMQFKRIAILGAAAAIGLVSAAAAQQPADSAAPTAVPDSPAGEAGVSADIGTIGIDGAFDAAFRKEEPPLLNWPIAEAEALLRVIEGIGAEGLDPRDYQPDMLRMAIALGSGAELDKTAARSFSMLVEDLRDGRTPMSERRQWFIVDPDADRLPTGRVMQTALATGDVAGTLASLNPGVGDYEALKQALAETDPADSKRVAAIRANMDRWRWLPRDLGTQYLLTNVPEYQLRLTVNEKIIRTYRTIVGKPGRTATPQLAEQVSGVIFNPTWTVPQSIVKGEGLGERVLGNPAWAKAQGYTATRGANGWITVVQRPGPTNSLGVVKLDMPNPHAIFLHDTPAKHLFDTANRAYSHGCIRTERALELGMTIAILGEGATKDQAVEISSSGKYTRVPVKKTMPVYITYFTMGRDIEGNLREFPDIYSRDAPVLASFEKPRSGDRRRVTTEKVEAIAAPGA